MSESIQQEAPVCDAYAVRKQDSKLHQKWNGAMNSKTHLSVISSSKAPSPQSSILSQNIPTSEGPDVQTQEPTGKSGVI